MEFKSTPLFGGAIVADLPVGFRDVSEIRQVPDTQEIYLSQSGYTSVLFDILERVTEPASDLEALKFHLSDIVDEDDMQRTTIVEEGCKVELGKMGSVKAYTLHATTPPSGKQVGRAHEPSSIEILVLLVRLENVATDLVITVNVPCGIKDDDRGDSNEDDDEKGRKLVDDGKEILERVRGSLEVREWGLFGGE